MTDQDLKRTPLYSKHLELGAKMVPFAGWEMPVQYSGLIQEHVAVRQSAGLFDVSHMGEITLRGPEAEAALQYLTCNDVAAIPGGRAQYNAIINPQGGVVDDIIVYKKAPNDFFICVNASNSDKDFEWFTSHNRWNATFENVSPGYGQVALQGPKAWQILDALLKEPISETISHFCFSERIWEENPIIIARTGYTGEDGFEIFIEWEKTPLLWDALLREGAPSGLIPSGLGARDTLRLEACYSLHGHEITDETSAIHSGLGWIVKFGKGDFLGKEALASHKASGSGSALVGFFVDDPGIVREHTLLYSEAGEEIGQVTSGTKTPTVNRALGLALVKRQYRAVGTRFFADVRGRRLACHVIEKPFYSRKTNSGKI